MARKNYEPLVAMVFLVLLAVLIQPAKCNKLGDTLRGLCGFSSKVDIDTDAHRQMIEATGNKNIATMKSKVQAEELDKLFMLKRFVEKSSNETEEARLYRRVPTGPFYTGLAEFARVEMGLVYAKHDVPIQGHYEDVIYEKVYKRCERVHKYLEIFWTTVINFKRNKRDNRLPIIMELPSEQVDWLRVQSICNEVLKGTGDAKMEWAYDSYVTFKESLVESYKTQKMLPFLFPGQIEYWLRQLIPLDVDRLPNVIRYLTEEWWPSDESPSLCDNIQRETLVKGLAKFLKFELQSDEQSLATNFEVKLVAPCKTVHILLEQWWKDTHLDPQKSLDATKWSTVENICQTTLLLIDEHLPRTSSRLIDEIKAQFGQFPKN